MRHPVILALALCIVAGISACDQCGSTPASSVIVEIHNTDGELIENAQCRYLAVDEGWTGYRSCEYESYDHEYLCGWDVSGEIEIEASAPGYQTQLETVDVQDTECHVRTEHLDIELEVVS